MEIKIKDTVYKTDKFGFLKQENPKPFPYSVKYTKKQSTNIEMAWFRFGLLLSQVTPETIRTWKVVDVGSGNGIMVREGKKIFKEIVPFDIVGKDTITEAQLYSMHWNLALMFDVIEHYNDVEQIFKIKADYLMISFPETPKDIEDIKHSRHVKADEHIYHFRLQDFKKFAIDNGCTALFSGYPEDVIRKRWSKKDLPNIATLLLIR